MAKQVKVVIGANFGDEGKGLMTDYFASKNKNSIVVRFNGGAQAGHTVITPNNKEHVFSHFGSATMDNIPTYLSEFFLTNPILFKREHEQLLLKMNASFVADTYIDSNSIVTTPYDMMVNQIVEISRGDDRHGSCGYGISETVVRSEVNNGDYKLIVSDLRDVKTLKNKLELIRDVYTPMKLSEYGITNVPSDFERPLVDDGIIAAFIEDCKYLLAHIKECDRKILNRYTNVVLEGAQGLLLDQNGEYAPHVTHSSTGMDNVDQILSDLTGDYDVEVTYVTRCYVTRHGAGPFPNEVTKLPYSKIVDTTNIPNQWQGSLRFGILDIDSLHRNVANDFRKDSAGDIKYSLAVTCLDQVDDNVKFFVNNEYTETSILKFLSTLESIFSDTLSLYGSWGRTRETVHRYK